MAQWQQLSFHMFPLSLEVLRRNILEEALLLDVCGFYIYVVAACSQLEV